MISWKFSSVFDVFIMWEAVRIAETNSIRSFRCIYYHLFGYFNFEKRPLKSSGGGMISQVSLNSYIILKNLFYFILIFLNQVTSPTSLFHILK